MNASAPRQHRSAMYPVPAEETLWRGRSGRIYALRAERAESFALLPDSVYLLAKGPAVTWVGTRDDIEDDAASRSRFRLALNLAGSAFRLPTSGGPLERMTIVWDLEGGERVPRRTAA